MEAQIGQSTQVKPKRNIRLQLDPSPLLPPQHMPAAVDEKMTDNFLTALHFNKLYYRGEGQVWKDTSP